MPLIDGTTEEQLKDLARQFDDLRNQINNEEFSDLHRFIKDVYIAKTARFKLEEKDANSTSADIGELEVVGGKLYVASAADTLTDVALQTLHSNLLGLSADSTTYTISKEYPFCQ